jgi:hypothetical protein
VLVPARLGLCSTHQALYTWVSNPGVNQWPAPLSQCSQGMARSAAVTESCSSAPAAGSPFGTADGH